MRLKVYSIAGCLIATLSCPSLLWAGEQPFNLICEFSNENFHGYKSLFVDPGRHEVNGRPATFLYALIKFTRLEEGVECYYEINRLNAAFLYICSSSRPGIPDISSTGRCTKNASRQF